ncbi:MAG: hypothetical protein H0U28_15660 [Nocardioidaceae bacterium]|nr:hypothetical protein [Nocardioidaceae bacterium]
MLGAWGLPEPEAVHRPTRGTNNIVRIIQTAPRRYVLRTYQNLTAQRVDAEHARLTALARRMRRRLV